VFVAGATDAPAGSGGEGTRVRGSPATTYEPHLQRADVRLLYDRFDQRAQAERLVTDFAQPRVLPGRARAVVSVDGLRDRATVRRLSIRACRPHVAARGDRRAPARSVGASS